MITEEIIKQHGLTAEEYKRIVDTLKREPNLVELGVYSVMWSEHCSYKSSKIYLRNFPTKGKYVLQGPGENAGVVDIGDGLAAVFKMESHNHPSFIEPYQGAATGVGGILRDVFTMGARPVAILDSLRFGSFDNPRTRYLVDGVVSGIAGYGNCIGVPTVGGEVYFHPSYNGNCLVNVMTVGIVKKGRVFKGLASGVGNPVIYVGSKTGRDGIHGAVMASDVFGSGGEERRPTVQVGDPFTEKLLLEACLELFKTDYIVGIQDMGAAGLTSSSVEMAGRGASGIEIDVDAVPRREEGMSAYEVLLSESQERMLIVARLGKEEEVKAIFRKWDLEAEVIGRVTGDGMLHVVENGETAARIPVASLTDDAPVYERPLKKPAYLAETARLDYAPLKSPRTWTSALIKLLRRGEIASKEWIYRQYDHMVRTDTAVLPGSDAAVIRIKGAGNKALAATVDCNPVYCYLDPYRGAAIAVAEAARNLAVSGAVPLGLTDCLNFGSPENPEVMWQFKEAVNGIKEACITLDIPVIGGNVSFYNETSSNAVHPTPSIGMVGLIEDIAHHTTQWFKGEGDVVAVIGPHSSGLEGSAYLREFYGLEKGGAPKMMLDVEKRVHEACLRAIKAGIIVSAHDVSDGGLAVALAECCLNPSGPIGAAIDAEAAVGGARVDEALFGESQSRVVVTVKEWDLTALENVCADHGVEMRRIGATGGDRLVVTGLIDAHMGLLSETWRGALGALMAGGR